MQEFKTLVRLLNIGPGEISFTFERGKPKFDDGLHEFCDNVSRLQEKLEEGRHTIKDTWTRQSIVYNGLRFIEKYNEALKDYFKKRRNN